MLHRLLLREETEPSHHDLISWLSLYLQRRIQVTAWALDHWDAGTTLPPDLAIEESNVRATLDRLHKIFRVVRRDAELRAQLHWHNGVLAAPHNPDNNGDCQRNADEPVIDIRIHWPRNYCFTCPVKGGFGLFLGEVLINAVRHGKPGTTPRVSILLDPVRKELSFSVENAVDEPAPASPVEPAARHASVCSTTDVRTVGVPTEIPRETSPATVAGSSPLVSMPPQ